MNAPPPRRRWWPKSLAGKAAAFVLASFLVLIVAWFAALHFAQKRLDASMAEANRLEEVNSWLRIDRSAFSEGENAAVALSQAGELAGKTLNFANVTRLSLDRDDDKLLAAASSAFNDQRYQEFVDVTDALPLYRSLVDPTDRASFSREFDRFYDVARMETAAVISLRRSGKSDDAARRALRSLRLVRKFTIGEPWPLSQSIGHHARLMTIRQINEMLRTSRFSSSLHAEIEAELTRHDDAYRVAARAIHSMRNDTIEPPDRDSPLHQWVLLKPFGLIDVAHVQERHNAYVATLGMPFRHAKPLLRVRTPLAGLPMPGGWGASLVLHEWLLDGRVTFDRSIVLCRCLRVVNAMAAKRVFEAPIDSLGLPPACLVDPFDGENVRIKRTPGGPIVYSIGSDLTDDGGQLDDNKKPLDVGLGPVEGTKK